MKIEVKINGKKLNLSVGVSMLFFSIHILLCVILFIFFIEKPVLSIFMPIVINALFAVGQGLNIYWFFK